MNSLVLFGWGRRSSFGGLGRSWLILIIPILVLSQFGCSQPERSLLIFSAASLTDAMRPIAADFESTYQAQVHFSFGGSSSLAQQIARGASPDIFLSAGAAPMDRLVSDGLVDVESRTHVAKNSLVLVSLETAEDIEDKLSWLTSSSVRRIAIADPDLAPAGAYAKEALHFLGLWDLISSKLVFAYDVRTALAYVESEHVDAAVVYRTDADVRPRIQLLFSFPVESHAEIVYPVAVMSETKKAALSRAFLEFLTRPNAQRELKALGFIPVYAD